MIKIPGLTNRPGGFIITERALSFCAFPVGANVLDLGCGSGATVNYLAQNHYINAYGIDKNPEPGNTQCNLIKAPAEKLPFPPYSIDGVMMECSFSLVNDQKAVLKECHRVLKPGGRLIISNLYARGVPQITGGSLKRIDSKEYLISLIENNGFKAELFEDFTHYLKTLWGQMIFDNGAQSFYCDLGISPENMKRIKCGYCLIIAVKKEENE